ncbi:MAG: fused MFS/spermidine synthase [Chromatiales bacterium]|nr:fused MFS/spermidine synthase [Chromatiales bacterium]
MQSASDSHRGRLVLYALIVLLSSGALLVLEIVAGRLLAPYIGVSLYTWTSIIGVMLAGLSLGNWIGGVWADRGAGERAAAVVLLLAGLWCALSLALLGQVAAGIVERGLSLLSSGFLLAGLLFFMPAVLLGVVTPLLTTLALRLDTRTGHVVGRMHALAAVGSIAGTFAAGYWLIQTFGTYAVVRGTAVALFLMALPLLRRSKPVLMAVTVGVTVAVAMLGASASRAPCDRESAYFCIRVVDRSADAPFGQARGMVLDHLLHSINHAEEPRLLIAPYVHAMDELVHASFGERYEQGLNYFFAGGGAYTQPRAIAAQSPASRITVAELDATVTEIASEQMYFDSAGMKIVHDDARRVLAAEPGPYDVIVGDVFHDVAVPFHLVTREFFELARSRLTDDGLFVLNVVDAFPEPKLVKAVLKSLDIVFAQTAVYVDALPEQPTRVTYVIAARQSQPWPEWFVASAGIERGWYRIDEAMRGIGTALADLPALSDDYAPVERLIAPLLIGAND